jgi:hypothetical protein
MNIAVCRIIGNVAALVCGDPAETPDASLPDPVEDSPESSRLGGKKAKGVVDAPDTAAAAEAAAVARKVRFFHGWTPFLLFSKDAEGMKWYIRILDANCMRLDFKSASTL